jgi:hypothetical protein
MSPKTWARTFFGWASRLDIQINAPCSCVTLFLPCASSNGSLLSSVCGYDPPVLAGDATATSIAHNAAEFVPIWQAAAEAPKLNIKSQLDPERGLFDKYVMTLVVDVDVR